LRKLFAALAALLTLTIVVQFFLAGSAAFDTAPKEESFQAHRALGYGIVLLALVVTIAAAAGRLPGRLIGMAGLVAGLGVLQPVIRGVAAAFGDTADTSTTAGALVFGLHAINGLVMLRLAATVTRRARALPGSVSPVAPVVAPTRPPS
jgi:hypothetical protein